MCFGFEIIHSRGLEVTRGLCATEDSIEEHHRMLWFVNLMYSYYDVYTLD